MPTSLISALIKHYWIQKKKNYIKRPRGLIVEYQPKALKFLLIWPRLYHVSMYIQPGYTTSVLTATKENPWGVIQHILKTNTKKLPGFNNNLWLNKFLGTYMATYLGLPLAWQILNFKPYKKVSLINKAYRVLRSNRLVKRLKLTKLTTYKLLTELLILHKIDLLVSLTWRLLQDTPLRRQKTIFRQVHLLLAQLFALQIDNNTLKGYKLFFKGKLGRKGSVKKSKFFAKKGRTSFTNKTLKYNYKNFLVFTETGVVGCYIAIFY